MQYFLADRFYLLPEHCDHFPDSGRGGPVFHYLEHIHVSPSRTYGQIPLVAQMAKTPYDGGFRRRRGELFTHRVQVISYELGVGLVILVAPSGTIVFHVERVKKHKWDAFPEAPLRQSGRIDSRMLEGDHGFLRDDTVCTQPFAHALEALTGV